MKFIQCKSCHHFNPIKSEYQIFCDACGKKLPDNFKIWQQKHPNKNFEDYKIAIGVDKQISKPKRKKIGLKKILQISFFVVSLSIGFYFGKKQGHQFYLLFHELAYPTSELLEKEWSRQYFLDKQVSLESPYLLEKETAEIPLTKQIKNLIVNMDIYISKENDMFNIAFSTATFKESVGSVNLKGASDGSITEAMQKVNGSDLFYSDKNTFINQYSAIIKKGTFVSDGNNIYFKSVTCAKNNLTLIQFMAFWIGENKDYELLTNRMINSLDIR